MEIGFLAKKKTLKLPLGMQEGLCDFFNMLEIFLNY